VTGEFHRLVGDCVAYLDANDAPRAESWQRELERAAAGSDASLEAAALAALHLLEDEGRKPELATARERDEFAGLVEHLAAICRAIVGRPAGGPAQEREKP
jgi:hypothetical protein